MSRRIYAGLILFALVYFAWVCSIDIDLLGMSADSAGKAYRAARIARTVTGIFTGDATVRDLPLMSHFYRGLTLPYMAAAGFGLFGRSIFVFRYFPVLAITAGLGAMAWCLWRWFGPRVGALVCLLTVLDNIFVRHARTTYDGEVTALAAFFWIFMALLQAGLERPRLRGLFFFVAGLAAGAGAWIKLSFLWYLVGMALACLLFLPELRRRLSLGFGVLGGLAAGFALALFPFLLWNYTDGWVTVSGVWNSLVPDAVGANINFDLPGNFLLRLRHLLMLVAGDTLVENITVPGCRFWLWLVCGCAFYLSLVCSLRERPGFDRARLGFLLVVYVTVFFGLLYAPVSFESDHLILVAPLPALAVALALESALFLRPGRALLIALGFAAALAYYAGAQVLALGSFFDSLRAGRALGEFSPWHARVADAMRLESGADRLLIPLYFYGDFMEREVGRDLVCYDQLDLRAGGADMFFEKHVAPLGQVCMLAGRRKGEKEFTSRIIFLASRAGYRIGVLGGFAGESPEFSYLFYRFSRQVPEQ